VPSSAGDVCDACLSPCATCLLLQSNCTSCLGNLSLFLQGNSCVDAASCSNGSFADLANSTCTPCSSPCLTCTNETDCSSCTNGTYLSGSSCLPASQCPNGTVAGTNPATALEECLPCASSCLTCGPTITSCTSCNASDVLFLVGTSCLPPSSCPNFTYPNASSAQCDPCPAPCLSCLNSSVCLSCKSGYFLLSDGSCLTSCPSDTYPSSSSGI
jgi:proprotein convertase subtilisin/kexin type 5